MKSVVATGPKRFNRRMFYKAAKVWLALDELWRVSGNVPCALCVNMVDYAKDTCGVCGAKLPPHNFSSITEPYEILNSYIVGWPFIDANMVVEVNPDATDRLIVVAFGYNKKSVGYKRLRNLRAMPDVAATIGIMF